MSQYESCIYSGISFLFFLTLSFGLLRMMVAAVKKNNNSLSGKFLASVISGLALISGVCASVVTAWVFTQTRYAMTLFSEQSALGVVFFFGVGFIGMIGVLYLVYDWILILFVKREIRKLSVNLC